jgi:hypothetical protein
LKSKAAIFENNTFEDNISFEGGAVKIDTAIKETIILFRSNNFTRNMAYIEGNSIIIKNYD